MALLQSILINKFVHKITLNKTIKKNNMAKEKEVSQDNEKLKALKLTMEKIDKDYGKGSIMKLGDKETVVDGQYFYRFIRD
jgi:hypothetical protein